MGRRRREKNKKKESNERERRNEVAGAKSASEKPGGGGEARRQSRQMAAGPGTMKRVVWCARLDLFVARRGVGLCPEVFSFTFAAHSYATRIVREPRQRTMQGVRHYQRDRPKSRRD